MKTPQGSVLFKIQPRVHIEKKTGKFADASRLIRVVAKEYKRTTEAMTWGSRALLHVYFVEHPHETGTRACAALRKKGGDQVSDVEPAWSWWSAVAPRMGSWTGDRARDDTS